MKIIKDVLDNAYKETKDQVLFYKLTDYIEERFNDNLHKPAKELKISILEEYNRLNNGTALQSFFCFAQPENVLHVLEFIDTIK